MNYRRKRCRHFRSGRRVAGLQEPAPSQVGRPMRRTDLGHAHGYQPLLLRTLMYWYTNTPMSMYSLNAVSGTPIYRQIVGQTYQLVASGQLPPGKHLPSVRTMAADLGINPMTVSKAYSLLERDGIVTRQRGLGMVVVETTITPAETIRPQALALVEAARRLRLTRKDVVEAIDIAWRPNGENT